ncbi:hypothetical protein DFH07DRAFT_854709 [Mycena maculata]|uniref:Uncharacterized protein n=1 Tax=Mycena maculata TaxID=230809 RepID=A0AAD7HN69_9AGAR|nr:hypothetical protein DFH07DRAFT_854709 [Mycena maculata]
MATIAKTLVATGASSGLGFEAIKQLLAHSQPYKFILGARDTTTTQAAYDALAFDHSAHSLAVLPLELSDLKGVKAFAQKTLALLGQDRVDVLLLNAAISTRASQPAPHGSKWCEAYVVNHLSQHYLVHLLRDKLVQSQARIVFVSSGAIAMVSDPSTLEASLQGTTTEPFKTYAETKFVQLLSAHWWRRQLAGQCAVLAVSPGLVPATGLARGSGMTTPKDLPDAKSVAEGAASILAALTRSDFPEDPDRIFLTSWGEWWGKDVYARTLDKELQDAWAPSREEIESDAGIAA